MFPKLPLLFTLFCALAITGCNDDDPVNDTGIADVLTFDIDDYTAATNSTNLAGVWVAVGTGTFERGKSGDRKFGEQSAKIYFLITGSAGSYQYGNCFDEGSLEEGFNRGGFDALTVTGNTIVFDSDKTDGELSSDDDDTRNTGDVTDNVEINTVFTFDDGNSKEVNTFQIRKVSNDASIYLGTSNFKETDKGPIPRNVTCFAQWSGSYSTSNGYYTVERFDASFEGSIYPFSASEYYSGDDRITEYSTLVYSSETSVSTKDSDSVNFFYALKTLYFSSQASGTSIDKAGTIDIDHANLK
jgi:hypothetical protein